MSLSGQIISHWWVGIFFNFLILGVYFEQSRLLSCFFILLLRQGSELLLFFFSIAVINTITKKQFWKGRPPSLTAYFPHKGKYKLKQGPWQDMTYSGATQSLLGLPFKTTQDHLCRGGTTPDGPGPPTSSLFKKVFSQTYLQTNLMEAFCSVLVPSSQITLAFV